MERHRLSIGPGGWVRFMASDWPAVAYLRYEDSDGRLVAVEIHVERLDEGTVTGELLRTIPIGHIDLGVNALGTELRSKLELVVTDVRTELRWMFPGSRPRAPRPGRTGEKWLRPLDPPPPVDRPSLDAALAIPASKPYGDDFYRQVADVYRRLAPWDPSPALLIAEDNAVPATTAHRWIKIARTKGFLEPGRRGRRTDGER